MNNSQHEKDWRLLEGWLEDPTFIHWARQTNQKDVAHWENFLNQNPGLWELAKMGKALVTGIPFRQIAPQEQEGQQALRQMLSRLESDNTLGFRVRHKRETSAIRYWWVAASVALVVLMTGGIYRNFYHNPQVVWTTSYGEHLEQTLPDSSIVILNANSILKYYKQDPRSVELEGEAYFEVRKKPETGERFQVMTRDLAVTVLGTSFNVNTRNDQTKVFLEEGKITIDMAGTKSEMIEMQPGDLISYSSKSRVLQENRKGISALEAASWKEGSLIFKDTPLMEALFEIEDIYGIQFVIRTDALKAETISGGVPIRDLEITLMTLTEVYGIQMEQMGKRYFVSGRN
jgi:transmembrane sensor